MKYYSQYKQDMFIDKEVFNEKYNGFFVDIGAWDGICYSNSYFFEKNRNWTGICVEPLKLEYKKLEKNRDCISLNYAISAQEGIKKFLTVDHPDGGGMLSGLVDKFQKKHMKRINQYKNGTYIVDVECKRFNNILNEYNIKEIDYCSIDVEGPELEILKDIDFNTFTIKTFSIENNYYGNKIKKFMDSKNYKFIKKLGCDELYIRKDFS